ATLIILFGLRDPEPCVLVTEPEQSSVRDVLGGDHKECYLLTGAPDLSPRAIVRIPHVGRILTLQFLVFLAFNFYYVAFPVYAATALAWTLLDVGLYFAAMGILMAVVEGPVLGRLSRRVGDRPLVIAGSLLLAASFVFFISERTAVLYAGTALLAVGNGLMWPSLLAVLSKTTDRDAQGAVQGFSGSVNAVASILGLLLGGLVYQAGGSGVFLLSAVMTAAVCLLAFGLPRVAVTRTG
ncbi:MAG: MFS transporter, partial [Gemmatimonadetes bacterium]|nr:MFS transporter [Gemmatimonadota bacterium]NIQ53903.1 MFS transporter [Gemmatimonadota bacterium]NIU74072.1 MFS transporter [Gammaproteobacteria bacterium]NIX44128.1 MFS transporter [Gemmatimonadota bacterium]NIY08365.1 MFS transporter [Gemmatimonadota bacterium]